MKGDVADNLVSKRHCSQQAADLIYGHTALSSAPWHLKEKYQHTTINMNRTLEDGGSMVMALEDGGGAAALGGGFWWRLKIVAAALGGGCSRRTCNNGIGIRAVKAKGYCHNLTSALARTAREDVSDARDVHW